MRGSDYLLQILHALGVNYIFGLIGREASSFQFDENYTPRFLFTKHENSAAIMASTLSRLTKHPQVCWTSRGSSATNAITGTASALLDRCPLLVLSAQVERDRLHKTWHECLDLPKLFAPICKYATELQDLTELPLELGTASFSAMQERPGPAFISIPMDLLLQQISPPAISPVTMQSKGPFCEQTALEAVLAELQQAQRPLLFSSALPERVGALAELKAFVEKFSIPVLTSYTGKGVLPEDHPLAFGAVSQYIEKFFGEGTLPDLFAEVDLLLLLGPDFAEEHQARFWDSGVAKKIVRIDAVTNSWERFFTPSFDLAGDVAGILSFLTKGQDKPLTRDLSYVNWFREVRTAFLEQQGQTLEPQCILRSLRKLLEPEDTLVSNFGLSKHFGGLFYKTLLPNTFLCSDGLAPMTYALPAGMAAKLAQPERTVCILSGDGGFLPMSQELETCRRYNLNVICVVLKDNRYSIIDYWRKTGVGEEASTQGLGFAPVDYAKLAEAYGCRGYSCTSLAEFESCLQEAKGLPLPSVIEVPVEYNINLYV